MNYREKAINATLCHSRMNLIHMLIRKLTKRIDSFCNVGNLIDVVHCSTDDFIWLSKIFYFWKILFENQSEKVTADFLIKFLYNFNLYLFYLDLNVKCEIILFTFFKDGVSSIKINTTYTDLIHYTITLIL